mmetsp:Transcript_10056/g.11743  ORF Transcript_10056/g.11743 Transcript_10056/m.11743 type:complete len:170 (-) Transcript_10056:509-1018(-)|eukprot:CAMPEP_0197847192 /NCGR_PEP_ID=MMETSP1438-20131217/5471_1 /TAXON_ID=1461541 /ORGANISM="Pterosperma sp., Strain CCMP1384" /LENGTH=169 /DNA_ID=CAMNT_0043459053 /DNA_START=89 /DNA_END=598 /DNA_ORIENTATION=-
MYSVTAKSAPLFCTRTSRADLKKTNQLRASSLTPRSGINLSNRRNTVSLARKGALVIEDKFVLVNVGDGSCDHLPKRFPKPGDYELSGDEVTVGRDSPADIVIPIPTVSGTHCQIAQVNGLFYIMDLSSTNGTYVNGKQLTAAKPEKLPLGSEIVFGDEFLARYELIEE